ncbi:hypothetical protein [Arthrobacter sp. fls2-241-R2A-200]|uniref:hypothetical protein n=1 Tax=Arthrobacter sp. fls2-241-R2A-200 TaxID=3040281 RepID=UPI00255137F8|nr:hypothetical protein [Arthrobacter sp. fls2-241-R2A-200]
MPDLITTPSMSAGAASSVKSGPLACAEDDSRPALDVLGQTRSVSAVREQFNPFGVGLRSIWPQSVCGF